MIEPNVWLGTTDPAVVLDRFGHVVQWNTGAEVLFGLRSAEAQGHLCYRLFNWCDGEGRAVCTSGCPMLSGPPSDRLLGHRTVWAECRDGKRVSLDVATITIYSAQMGLPFLAHVFRQAGSTPTPEPKARNGGANGAAGTTPDDFAVPWDEPEVWPLTARERQVLQMLANGNTVSDVARYLGLSQATVRNHVQHIREKLNVRSQAQAIVWAYHAGSALLSNGKEHHAG